VSIHKKRRISSVFAGLDIPEKRGRDRLFIMAEVLDIAQGGALKTQIMYRANLSFLHVNRLLAMLTDLHLLESVEKGGKTTYKTTDKGFRYLESYRAILEFARKHDVKYKRVSQLRRMSSAIRELQKAIKDTETNMMNLTKCLKCKSDIFPDFRFCPYCGKNLQAKQTKSVTE